MSPSLCAFASYFKCTAFIVLSTEYFQFHINFFSFQFFRSLGFPQSEGHTRRLTLPLCQIPMRVGPKDTYTAVSATGGHCRGAIGPVPAAQLVTPDHAQQLPWQPLHCAPWRPRVTTADATTSRPTPFSPPQHALTQHQWPCIPATCRQKQSVRLSPKVSASGEVLSLCVHHTQN